MLNNVQQFNINGADVYVAQFDKSAELQPVLPAARQHFIEQCDDPLHRSQRYFAWLLLDYALKQRCGKGVKELDFNLDGNGKWSCNGGVSFSLSHSGCVVAVAVAECLVGIDVERLDKQRFNSRLADRILTESERKLYEALPSERRPKALAETWTKKESLFKRSGGKTFTPKQVDTTANKSYCQEVEFDNEQYVVAVSV